MHFSRVILALTPSWKMREASLLAPAEVALFLRSEGGYQELGVRDALCAFDAMDPLVAAQLREFAGQAHLSRQPLSELGDHGLVALFRQAIRDGRLMVLRESSGTSEKTSKTVDLRRLVKDIEQRTRGILSDGGRQYRLVADTDLAKVPGRDSYDVVGRDEARRVLNEVAKQSAAIGDLPALLGKANDRLTPDWRPSVSQPDGLILLRRNRALAAEPADASPAITPSQLRKLMTPANGVFEVRVMDEVGVAVSGLEMVFTIEGSRHPKKTGGDGKARIDDVPGEFASVTLASAQSARTLLKDRWDEARAKPLIKPAEDVVSYRLSDDLPTLELETNKTRTLCIRPFVVRGRLFGGFFDTSKSFVLPNGIEGVRGLVKVQAKHPNTQLLVVGHTDTAGRPAYNDPLSRERAAAMAAYLTGAVEDWYTWYGHDVASEKRWGNREDLAMIDALPDADGRQGGENPVHWFQRTRGLKVDDIAGQETRHALIKEYMALEGTSLPDGVHVTTHGCGENFPAEDTGDGVIDQENRRVEIFLFDAKLGIQPKPPGKNSAPASTAYPEWGKRAGAPIDFFTEADAVALAIEWPEDVVSELPDDVAVVLTGEGLDPQKHLLAAANRDDGVIRVSFDDLDPSHLVTLTAKHGSRELVLFRDHRVGDLDDPTVWEHTLDELIADDDCPDDGLVVTGSLPDDAEADLTTKPEPRA